MAGLECRNGIKRPQMVRHGTVQAWCEALVDHVHTIPMAGGEVDVEDAEHTPEEEDDRYGACDIHVLFCLRAVERYDTDG